MLILVGMGEEDVMRHNASSEETKPDQNKEFDKEITYNEEFDPGSG